jgi:hypothetical protein
MHHPATARTPRAARTVALGEHLLGSSHVAEEAAALVILVDRTHLGLLAVSAAAVVVAGHRQLLHLGVLAGHPRHVVVVVCATVPFSGPPHREIPIGTKTQAQETRRETHAHARASMGRRIYGRAQAQLIGTEASFSGSAPGLPSGVTMTWSCSSARAPRRESQDGRTLRKERVKQGEHEKCARRCQGLGETHSP